MVAVAVCAMVTELRAQTAAPVNIPLQFWNGAEKLQINVGINGGAPQPYIFDTGSPVFNAVYNPSWWPGLVANPNANNAPSSSLPTSAQFCLGGSTSTFCRGYTGNLVQVPSLSFYKTLSDPAPVTLQANPGYVVNAAYNYGASAGPPTVNVGLPFTSPPVDGQFYGTFGAGNFAPDAVVNASPDFVRPPTTTFSGYYAGGVLGQTIVSGVTQGYVVAANGQPNPVSSVNGPQQANGINVTIGGQTSRPVSACSPCVTVGLTPQMLGQFWAAPPTDGGAAGVIPWAQKGAGTFPNPYGGSVGNNASRELGTHYRVTLTAPGATTPAINETSPGLLDSGTADLTLTATSVPGIAQVSTNGHVNPDVVLTVAGATPDFHPIPGLTTTSETIGQQTPPAVTYNGTLTPVAQNQVQNVIGISFFLENSVLYDLTHQVIGYTPFFVTDAPLATTAAGPLIVDGTNVPLGLAGIVSGPGGVTIHAGGAVQFSATNTYSGLTSITGGAQLFLSGPGSIASSSGVLNNGVFDISRTWSPVSVQSLTGTGVVRLGGQTLNITNAAGTFAGTIDNQGAYPGTGGGIALSGGSLILSGANSYTGGTVVTGGAALGLFADGALGSTSGGLTLNGGSLVALASFSSDRAITMGPGGGAIDTNGSDLLLSSTIGGTGGLTKAGAGILTVSGASVHQGGTFIDAGTLRLATGASLPTTGALTVNGGTLDVNGNDVTIGSLAGGGGTIALGAGMLTVAQAGSSIFAGAITGTGGLTKSGSGQLTLAGASSYTGPTSVIDGRLAVNGSIVGDVTVGRGGNLGGTGTLFGTVVNHGVLAPGNSIGTLTVNGSYTQAAGSTYQVETDAQGQADRTNVTGAPGTATLNGGIVQVLAAPGVYAPSTTYTILNATGGISGAYAGATSNYPFLQPLLAYDTNTVYLTLRPGGFAAGAATRNQAAVGAVLDRSVAGSSGDFAMVIGTMSTLTSTQGQATMNAISGQNYSGFANANVAGGLTFMNAVGRQLDAARGGDPGKGIRTALAEACGEEGACAPSPWSLWATGLAGFGSIAGNANAGTMTYSVGGVATGIDYRVMPSLLLGGGVGFSSGSQWTDGFSGRGTTDSYQAALYASFTQGGLWVDGLAGYAWNDNRMQRQIVLPGLPPRTANGATGASQLFGQIEAGYRVGLWSPANATIAPFARLQGTTVMQNGFTESGAQSLSLAVASQTTDSLRSTLGVEATAQVATGASSRLGLLFRLGWVHEYANTDRPVTAAFAGVPGSSFTVLGATPTRDRATLSLAATTAVGEATSLFVRYDGEVGGGSDAHAFTAGFRMTW